MANPLPLTGLLILLMAWASASDLRTRRIPNACTVGGTMAAGAWAGVFDAAPASRVLAIVFVAGPLAAAWAFRPASLGVGDVKLAVLLASFLGWLAAPATVLGLVLAAGWAAAEAILGRRESLRNHLVPLAPFMAAGSALALALVG